MSGTMVVMLAVLVIWLGIFAYLVMLDRKMSRLNQGKK